MCLYLNTTFNVSKKLYCLFRILYLSVKVDYFYIAYYCFFPNNRKLDRLEKKKKEKEKR